jgi:hypothetical protein
MPSFGASELVPLSNILYLYYLLYYYFWVLLKNLDFFFFFFFFNFFKLNRWGNSGVGPIRRAGGSGQRFRVFHHERGCAARRIPMMAWDPATCSMLGPKQRSGPMGLHRMVLSQHMTRLEHCDASHMRPKIPALSKNFSRSRLKIDI